MFVSENLKVEWWLLEAGRVEKHRVKEKLIDGCKIIVR
jgi:hypothetical protein